MPTDPILQGRAALLRYRNGREDLAFAGMYFPPEPASHVKAQYWKVAKGIVDWMQEVERSEGITVPVGTVLGALQQS